MKLLALLPLAALAADLVVASAVPSRHHRISRALNRKRRCQARPQNTSAPQSSTTSPQITYPTPPLLQEKPPAATTTTTDSTPPKYDPPAQPQSGTISVTSDCGDIGATSDPTTTTGPNGSIYWLNCGIEQNGDGGWRPPYFTVDQVIAKDLETVLSWEGNPYEACRPHLWAFKQASNDHHIPAILLAAIAMQESSCDPTITGKNGEQGLMQITPDKCPNHEASDACKEVSFNIGAGARYLRSVLDQLGNNLPEALGQYNGWTKGMTYYKATEAATNPATCFAQNNLDYLHQTFNGWLQGIDPHARNMGVFFNLKNCR